MNRKVRTDILTVRYSEICGGKHQDARLPSYLYFTVLKIVRVVFFHILLDLGHAIDLGVGFQVCPAMLAEQVLARGRHTCLSRGLHSTRRCTQQKSQQGPSGA